jgi:hypothetical protein
VKFRHLALCLIVDGALLIRPSPVAAQRMRRHSSRPNTDVTPPADSKNTEIQQRGELSSVPSVPQRLSATVQNHTFQRCRT